MKEAKLKFHYLWHEVMEKYNFTNTQYGAVFRAMSDLYFEGKDTKFDDTEMNIIYEMAAPVIISQRKADQRRGKL